MRCWSSFLEHWQVWQILTSQEENCMSWMEEKAVNLSELPLVDLCLQIVLHLQTFFETLDGWLRYFKQ